MPDTDPTLGPSVDPGADPGVAPRAGAALGPDNTGAQPQGPASPISVPDLGGLTAALARQGDEIARLAADVRGRDAELVARTHALRAVEAEVAALRGSTSWRITAPVRAAVQLLRRGR